MGLSVTAGSNGDNVLRKKKVSAHVSLVIKQSKQMMQTRREEKAELNGDGREAETETKATIKSLELFRFLST